MSLPGTSTADAEKQQELERVLVELETRRIHRPVEFYKANPAQKRFHESKKRHRWFSGGNKTGKSVGGAADLCLMIEGLHPTRKLPPNPTIWVVTPNTYLQRDGAQQRLLRYLSPSRIAHKWPKQAGALDRIDLVGGGSITFKSYESDTDSFSAASVDVVWFDEEPPLHVFGECNARLVDTGGFWFCTMTPVQGITWSHEDIINGGDEKIDVIWGSTYDNAENIPKEAIAEFEQSLSPQQRAARVYGQYQAREGRILDQIEPKIHFIDDIPKLDPSWDYYVGIDTGRYFAAEFLALAPGKRAVFFDEIYTVDHTINQNARSILEAIAYYRIQPRYVIDQTSQFKMDLLRMGLPCVNATGELHASIDAMRRGINVRAGDQGWEKGNPLLYFGLRCKELRRQCLALRWDSHNVRSKKARILRDRPAPGEDHAWDAARYAYYEAEPNEPVPSPQDRPLSEAEQIRRHAFGKGSDSDLSNDLWVGDSFEL